MDIKEGVTLQGLDISMRPVLIEAERVWKKYGRPEGVTITSCTEGVHSPGSLHYYGLALDLRTRYFSPEDKVKVFDELSDSLPAGFWCLLHSTHIHVQNDALGKRLIKKSETE